MSSKSADTAEISPVSREIGSPVPQVRPNRGGDGRPLDGCGAGGRHWWGTWRRNGIGQVVELRCRRCLTRHALVAPV